MVPRGFLGPARGFGKFLGKSTGTPGHSRWISSGDSTEVWSLLNPLFLPEAGLIHKDDDA